MFIIAWIATLIINANGWFVIPELAQTIITVLAAVEALIYIIIAIINFITFNKIRKGF